MRRATTQLPTTVGNFAMKVRLTFQPGQNLYQTNQSQSSLDIDGISGLPCMPSGVSKCAGSPGTLNFGSGGNGTAEHLAYELFKRRTGIEAQHVPYRGGAAVYTDLIAGQIQVMFTTVSSAAALIESGQLRALAVTSAERSPAFPQLPTVAEPWQLAIASQYCQTQLSFLSLVERIELRPFVQGLKQEFHIASSTRHVITSGGLILGE